MAVSRFRMIAIDLDGTLLLPNGSVPPRAAAAVRSAHQAGYRICFATGRNFTESRAVLHSVGLLPESVFVGGAMVIDTQREKTLHRTVMHPHLAADLCRTFEGLGHAALALQDTCETGMDYLITGSIPVHDATRRWMASLKMGVHYVPSLATFDHQHTLRVGICCSHGATEQYLPLLRDHYGDRTMMHSLLVPGMNCEVLEVFDPAVNKWSGIQHVAEKHGIDPQEIIAIGDDMNDIPMLKNAGLGVAMGNAREGLKPFADRIIGQVTEDGLPVFLEELLADGVDAAA